MQRPARLSTDGFSCRSSERLALTEARQYVADRRRTLYTWGMRTSSSRQLPLVLFGLTLATSGAGCGALLGLDAFTESSATGSGGAGGSPTTSSSSSGGTGGAGGAGATTT